MQKNYKSLRVFKSDFLEKFTHVHPITPLIVWAPVVCWLTWSTFAVQHLSAPWAISAAVMGFLAWTLVEYILHRYIFHLEGDSPLLQRLHFLIHGLHHSDPIDPTRLVMPPAASIAIGGGLYLILKSIVGPVWIEPFFAGFTVGYLAYDYIHFAVHHFTPRTWVGKALKQHHMQHHYVSANSRWGVSSPLWDYVFGTLEDLNRSSAESSPSQGR